MCFVQRQHGGGGGGGCLAAGFWVFVPSGSCSIPRSEVKSVVVALQHGTVQTDTVGHGSPGKHEDPDGPN